ncbi:hypothetical protein KEM55_005558 [Ascosphaera atra]|nr:hypothetical protein KEM55_005558 [Ascosphaera atra]
MSQGMPYLPGRAEAEAGFTFGRQPAQQYDFTGVFTSNGVPRAHREILEGTSTPQHQQQQAPRYPLPSMYAAFPSAAVDPQMLKYEQDDAMDNMLAANPVTTATTASMNHTSGNVMDPALFACTQPGETLSPTSAISAASPVDAVYSPAANTSLAQEWTDGSLGFPQDSFILA